MQTPHPSVFGGKWGQGLLWAWPLHSCPGWSRTDPPRCSSIATCPQGCSTEGAFAPGTWVMHRTGCVPCPLQSKTVQCRECELHGGPGPPRATPAEGVWITAAPLVLWSGVDCPMRRPARLGLLALATLPRAVVSGPGHARTHMCSQEPPGAQGLFRSRLT